MMREVSHVCFARFCYTKAIQRRHDVARLCYEGNTISYSPRNAVA